MVGYECTAILVITVWKALVTLLMWACLSSPIWSHGYGTDLMFPLKRLPMNPLRVLGASALGRTCGEVVVWISHEQIILWCLLSNFSYNNCQDFFVLDAISCQRSFVWPKCLSIAHEHCFLTWLLAMPVAIFFTMNGCWWLWVSHFI